MTAAARFALVAGAVLGGIGVVGGAFGAHGLKAMLEASGQAANWETAARYGMIHALALLATGLLAIASPRLSGRLALATWCFVVGTLVFSGFLALLAVTGLRVLGAVVPIGGVLLVAGWALLAVTVARDA